MCPKRNLNPMRIVKCIGFFKVPMFLLALLVTNAPFSKAVPAYPEYISYTQPDGTVLSIKLRGDERVHWAETKDGHIVLNGSKNGWEYAVQDESGNMIASGVRASEVGKRSVLELDLLKKIPTNLFYSKEQIQKALSSKLLLNSQSNGMNTGVAKIPGIATPTQEERARAFMPQGNKKLLMILVQFADVQFSKTLQDFDGLMNGVNYTQNGAEGSVKDFFTEMSYSKFNLNTDVFGIYTASQNRAYYGANDESGDDIRAEDLMSEAILHAEANGVDFSKYDNDGDGTVDGVYVVYAGYGEATSGVAETIWPHASSISPALKLDGKWVARYSCSNELNTNNSVTTIGVICHEFGHVCGAPDYYDTDYETGGQFAGTGSWDLMATGVYNKTIASGPGGSKPAHFNPFEKVLAGWIDPIVLNNATTLQIPDVTTNPVSYIFNTATPDEYFIMENRQKTGFNAGCPGSGLMIYHYSKSIWDASKVKTYPQGFYPVCASATTNPTTTSDVSSYGTINSGGCPFPGTSNNTSFGDQTIPSSLSWLGQNTNSPLLNIAEDAGFITLTFKAAPVVNPILAFSAKPISSSQINLTWNKNAANDNVVIAVSPDGVFDNLIDGVNYSVGTVLPNGGTIVYVGSANGFTHTGLSVSTTYNYKIWSANSSLIFSASITQEAKTAEPSLAVFPLIEGFEGGIPASWVQEYATGQNDWVVSSKGINSHPSMPHSGAKLARFGDLTWGKFTTKLVSPPLDLAGATNPVLRFWHTQQEWGTYQDVLRVLYKTSASDTWKQLAIYPNSMDTWTMESIELPEISSTYYIAFEGSTKSGYGICLDDIELWKSNTPSNTWTGSANSNWFNASNWSNQNIPTLTTDVVIPAGVPNAPYLTGNGATCRHLTIESGATLGMNTALADTLVITGNWTNNGTFNGGIGTVAFVETSMDQTIAGTSKTVFYTILLKKGLKTNILEALSPIEFRGPVSTTSPLNLTSGTFKLSSNSIVVPFKNGTTLLSTCGLWNNGGTFDLSNSMIYLSGLFKSTAGTTNISQINVYGNNSIFDLQGGSVNLGKSLKPYNNSTSYSMTYNQAGGSLNFLSSSADSRFVINNPASTFTMSGGEIVVGTPSSGVYDYLNESENVDVTGGTLQIGNAQTIGSPTFCVKSKASVYNFRIKASGNPTVQLLENELSVLNDVELEAGSKLDANNMNVLVGGEWINSGTFLPGTGAVYLNGSKLQSLARGSNYTFNNLVVSNTSGVSYAAIQPLIVNGVLQINPSCMLQIEAGKALTTKSLKNNAGVGGLLLKSDPTSSATWMNTGVEEGQQATVEFSLASNKPTYFSSPISDATAAVFAPLSENAISYFDASTNPSSVVQLTNDATPLSTGRGYLAQAQNAGIYNFSGSLNDGEQSIVLSSTNATDAKAGFHLVGNPYPSYTKWNEVLKNNVGPSMWIGSNGLDGTFVIDTYSGGIGTSNGKDGQVNSTLKPMQGFWVKLGSDSNQGSLVFQNTVRSHDATELPSESVPTIRLKVSNGVHSDETVLALKANASAEFDAAKLSNDNPTIPELYALKDSKPLAIHFRNDFNAGQIIPLGFRTGKSGNFEISCSQLSPLGTSTVLILKDLETNTNTTLEAGTSYSFSSNDTTTNNRFQLHFANLTSLNSVGDNGEAFSLFQLEGRKVGIQCSSMLPLNTTLNVFDVLGQLVHTQPIIEGVNSTTVGFKKGVYLVQVQNGVWKSSRKLFIK